MKPKEKAESLIYFYDEFAFKPSPLFNTNFIEEFYNAKRCANLCADEQLVTFKNLKSFDEKNEWEFENNIEYWEEVKKEIQKF